MNATYYMNSMTGSVDTEKNWLSDGASLSDLTRVVSKTGKYPKVFNPAIHSNSIPWIEPHGNTGKRNAAKEGGKTGHISIRVEPEIKGAAMARAYSHGLTVSEYIARLIVSDTR